MASVSSLDQDMRKLRLDRYTPQATDEVKSWIENTLGEGLGSGDLLEALKDGVALCKLANLVLPPPGVRYKASSMPFTQRENISQFLTACERPPLNLPSHDRFLTVDLYDNKDPAQVLQCIAAFSRAANAVAPARIQSAIGPKRAASPTRVALGSEGSTAGRLQTTNTPITSWSKKSDEDTSAPAWNIHQYGYMGGASQGNQGITFGARRQIAPVAVDVPSLAEKERRRKEREVERERERLESEEAARKDRAQREDDERKAKVEEEMRWQEETRKAREAEKQALEAERLRWEDEERRWREEEERRKKEEDRISSLNGRFGTESHSGQGVSSGPEKNVSEAQRIRELEKQLEEAKERERQYQLERGSSSPQIPRQPSSVMENKPSLSYRRPEFADDAEKLNYSTPKKRDSWSTDERNERLQAGAASTPFSLAQTQASSTPGHSSSRPLPRPTANSSLQATPQSARSSEKSITPQPSSIYTSPSVASEDSPDSSSYPLPKPLEARAMYSSPLANPDTRTNRFLASNPAPATPQPRRYAPAEMGMTSTSERAAEDARRVAGQKQTKAGGWASKSLLEKEMERERERQREWEQQQMAKMGNANVRGIQGPREMGR